MKHEWYITPNGRGECREVFHVLTQKHGDRLAACKYITDIDSDRRDQFLSMMVARKRLRQLVSQSR